MDLQSLTQAGIELCREVAGFIKAQQSRVVSDDIIVKKRNSFVTYVDREAEQMIINRLHELLPKATFITEEDSIENTYSDIAWIVDPLDGTTNFLYGIPIYSTSIALQVKGRVVLGIVHAIAQDETFYAWQGGGSFNNGESIKISVSQNLSDAVISTGFPYNKALRLEKPYRIMKQILGKCRGVRRLGSAAMDLAYVACGRLDGYYESNLNAWDVAGGGIIIQEAGGCISDFLGTADWITGDSIIAANPVIHQALSDIIQDQI